MKLDLSADALEAWIRKNLRKGGRPLVLWRWQREVLESICSDATTVAVSIGRSQGKTTLMSALAASSIVPEGPLFRAGLETMIVGPQKREGMEVFREMVALLGGPDRFRDRTEWSFSESVTLAQVLHRATQASLRVYGSDRAPHGNRAGLILLDECAQLRIAWRADALWAAVRGTADKEPGAKLVVASTWGGPSSPSWWAKAARGEGVDRAHLWTIPEGMDSLDEANWPRSMPALPERPHALAQVRKTAAAVRAGELSRSLWEASYANRPVDEVETPVVVRAAAWMACETESLPATEGQPVLGVDLGGGASGTGLAAAWPGDAIRLEGLLVFGDRPPIGERARADNTDYPRMAEAGDLVLTSGEMPTAEEVLQLAVERWGPPCAIRCDTFHVKALRDAARKLGLVRPWVVYRRDRGAALRDFREAVSGGRVKVARSLAWRESMRAAVVVERDGQEVPLRGGAGHRQAARRDDLAQAAILAVAHAATWRPAPIQVQRWETLFSA